MKCQVSVGVKLRRRALVLPQDGEQQGVKQAGKQTMTLFCTAGFCGIYCRSNTLAKNLHLRCAVAAAADPRCSPWASQKWRCDIVCVWADGTGECSMLGGDRAERCHGDEVVNYYYHSITYHESGWMSSCVGTCWHYHLLMNMIHLDSHRTDVDLQERSQQHESMGAQAQVEAGMAQEQAETANDMRHGRGATMEYRIVPSQDEWNVDDHHGNIMLATHE